MENLEEKLLKLGIINGYKKEGLNVFYKIIREKEEARKEAVKENYDDITFELGYIHTKLKVINILISLKTTEKNKKDRERLANILIETAEELRSIEGEN